MRVLIASDHYAPGTGGAERQTRLLGQAMRARGDAVAIAVPWYPGTPRIRDDGGVAVHGVRELRNLLELRSRDRSLRHPPPFADPVLTRDLRSLIRDFEPDLVHSHGWITYSVVAALKGRDIPLLATARDYGYFCANRTLLHDGSPCSGPALGKCLGCAGRYYGVPKGWLATVGVLANRPRLRRRLTGIHSISTFVAQAMRTHLLAANSSKATAEFVIPSFSDESPDRRDCAVITPYTDALPSEPFILYVGQFRRAKGVGVLLEAYEQLSAPPPLVLIGSYNWDGPSEFPANVTALADLPHRAVMAAWDRALFGVMPSVWPEPFGSVVHEGMSRGKAIIGTNVGGHTDMIVDDQTGYLVPPGDVRALRIAMETLIADAGLRERLGRASRERAALFSANNVLPSFFAAFEAMSNRHRAPEQP